MKFLALALALLLAVGSQAAPMLADAPSQLQHIRAAADLYLTQAIARIKSALESIDDAELNVWMTFTVSLRPCRARFPP
ncbi:unnamed protein product [Tetraodon nigroviridis]|uniref:(spotted green pufferfish) hypothetical protein n=1 Tax=Tetraodon nigroviridis TaxID=99883 RepID=Q4RYS3_TETNG|nr:unnamed protein product [Tetraodon nigroviridis]